MRVCEAYDLIGAMQLTNFPVEVLQLITNELLAHHLGRLICCGNKTLLHRMGKEGGVALVSVELRPERKIVWPSLVKHFPELQTFKVIDYTLATEMPHSWKPNWKDLTRGLDAIELFYPGDTDEFITEANLKHLEYLESISCWTPMYGEDDVWLFGWIRTTCTLIRSLTLNGDDFFVGYLPETLEELSFSANLTTLPIYELPKMLIKFELFSSTVSPDLFDLICRLQHLETLIIHMALFDEADLARVPSSLTHLQLFVRGEIVSSTLKLLPPNLLTLLCIEAHVTSSSIKQLPRKLLKTDVIHRLTLADVPSLPPGIQYLNSCNVTLDVAAILPSSVRSFATLESTSQWTVTNSQFTPSLQRLQCPFLPSATADGLCSLPSRLRILEIQGTSCIDDLPNNRCSPLPSGLSKLVIQARHFEDPYVPTGNEVIVSNAFLERLPPHLASLKLSGVLFLDGISFTSLPTTLTSLALTCNSIPFGSPATLPESLQKLTILLWEPPRKFSAHLLKHLPHGLKTLFYGINNEDDDCEVVNDVVMQLPPRITRVNLPFSSLLDTACTKMLPKSVCFFRSGPIVYTRGKTLD